jgi:hypothetical protein
MPIANTAAPTNSGSPIGPAVAIGLAPKSPIPVDAISAISVAAVPRSSAWARRPWPLPTAMS